MSIEDPTVLGRLLEELSWEGHGRIKTAYRTGGRGQENVLAAEVLMPLDFLPRSQFSERFCSPHTVQTGPAPLWPRMPNSCA